MCYVVGGRLLEWLKNIRHVVLRNSLSVVLDRKLQMFLCAQCIFWIDADIEIHESSSLSKLDGVAQEIENDLLDTSAVREHKFRQIFFDPFSDFEIDLLRLGTNRGGDGTDAFPNVGRLNARVYPASRKLGIVQHIVYHGKQ
jgi:hypothetical protein